jgi:condensin-2 complex subunit H2
VQSELAVRVSSWRSRIDPILAAEEDRSAFDIHDYGSKILERLQETKPQPAGAEAAAEAEVAAAEKAAEEQGQQNDAAGAEAEIVDFKQVAGATDSFEVCRLFAAMLQLVNNR